MSLQKMKELEDIKAINESVNKELSALIRQRKEESFTNSKLDFENFFKEQGFSVGTSKSHFNASYGNIKINVFVPDVTVPFVGAYSVWNLELNSKKYNVIINELGHYPKVTSKVSSAPNNDEERMQRELDDLNERTAATRKFISEFSTKHWGYGLVEQQESKTDNKYPQYSTFKELLENLFK